jgi:hypothetical protein
MSHAKPIHPRYAEISAYPNTVPNTINLAPLCLIRFYRWAQPPVLLILKLSTIVLARTPDRATSTPSSQIRKSLNSWGEPVQVENVDVEEVEKDESVKAIWGG